MNLNAQKTASDVPPEARDYSNECLRNVDYGTLPEIPGGHKENDQSAEPEDSVWIFQTTVSSSQTSEVSAIKMQKKQAKTLIPL